MSRIGVLGAGSWGTALAIHLARNGHQVRLWARDRTLVARMRDERRNGVYLPDAAFPAGLTPTAQLDVALDGAAYVLTAVPSHGLRAVMRDAAPLIPSGVTIVSATKGIEAETLRRMSELIVEEAGDRHVVAVVSGPSFATEVARRLPTALSVACVDAVTATTVQHEFRGPSLRLYVTDDVAGVEMGGAMKNVTAIAAGVVDGLGLGHNAMAALITRGLAEMARLACAVGARRDTLAGLSGLGDLVLTCTGELSRNRTVGVQLGRGRSLEDILSGMRMVAEGVRTTDAALALGAQHGVELPIAAQMAAVLHGRVAPLEAVERLMLRPPRAEH
ncbi:MAG: NAD(P)-dependent glycerol-3-phosphate dehydrogenase [Acidobacteria bacterium]|nr:NAD(P)-dependent glycerol-3-phosphate dehydrogenase [Acidobacteriota bacterium]